MTWSGDQPGAWGPPPGAGAPTGAWGPPGGPPRPIGWGTPLPPLPPHLKQRNGPAILISAACVLVALSLVGGLIALSAHSVVKADAGRAKAGDCVDFTVEKAPSAGEPAGAAFAEKADCDDERAAYLVGVRLEDLNASCPGEDYASYFEAEGLFGAFKLCLIPNVAAGDCFVESETHTGRFPCSQGRRPGSIRVLRVVHGAADPSRCAEFGADVLVSTYPTPATTICFEPFGPGGPGGTGPGRNT